jgi:AhpD family alkylhydroperoxidase
VTESRDKKSTTMPRLNAVDPARATAKDLLAAVKAQLGLTPNMMRTMATSPAVLEGYLSFGTALAGGSLPARLREQIALSVAEANGCDYCLSAHTALGRLAGLKDDEIARSREGASTDPETDAVLRFAVGLRIIGSGARSGAAPTPDEWRPA